MGKTYFANNNKDTCTDSDSSNFSWIKDEKGENTDVRNPDFPENYIQHIKDNIGKYEYILVSSHDVVRAALRDNCLFFYLVYPEMEDKKEFLKRYKERGSPQYFLDILENNFEKWLADCREQSACAHYTGSSTYLSDILPKIKDFEGD
jgi:hypothetical protein